MSEISRSQRKRENVMRGNPMMEGIASPRSEVEEARARMVEDTIDLLRGAKSVDAVRSVLTALCDAFASHICQQERERAAKKAKQRALNAFDPPDEELAESIAAAIRES